MKREIAKKVFDLAQESIAKLNATAHLVKDNCDESEFVAFRRSVGFSIAKIMEEILEPIYKEHPDLKPY